MEAPWSDTAATQLADTFRLLSDATRLKLVLMCMQKPHAVGDMAEAVGASVSLVSHHLRLLRATRLLRAKREGRNVIYMLEDEHIAQMLKAISSHITECGPVELSEPEV